MKKRYIGFIFLILILAIYFFRQNKSQDKNVYDFYTVSEKSFVFQFSSTGVVTPKNRIMMTAPVTGRVEKIFVEEGDVVQKGQKLAEISSADRVALIEAFQNEAQVTDENRELLKMYNPTPVRSPLAGRVLAKKLVQGQTVSSETVLFEVADTLRFVSKVDESDIGRVKLDQKVEVKFDAFPGEIVSAKVERIGEQSTTVNNVTTFEVFLEPLGKLDQKYRSGMTVTTHYEVTKSERSLVLPVWLVEGRKNTQVEIEVRDAEEKIQKKMIKIGENNGEFVEVLEGLQVGEVIRYRKIAYSNESKALPFGMGGQKKK